jgi:tetratricopeptide (TPR) repeat protein
LLAVPKEEPTKDQILSRANEHLAAEQNEHLATEHYDKGEKEDREVLRLAPEDPTALRQLGIIYLDQGQILQAYPVLKKSEHLQPDDPEIRLRLGLIFLALGDYTQARDAALQVLDKQPGQEQALRLLVDASRKAAAKRQDDDHELVYYLGEVYHQLKQYSECKATLDAIADCTKTSPLIN